jgi:hypothetical protein
MSATTLPLSIFTKIHYDDSGGWVAGLFMDMQRDLELKLNFLSRMSVPKDGK